MSEDGRVLTFEDLKLTKRWPYSREHTYVLVKSGKFPKPFKVGRLNLWMESDIDAFLAAERTKAILAAERAKAARGT